MSADTVVFHKYIKRRGQRVGYYLGYTLANRMGLSTQVPFTEEITSNLAPAAVRELTIKDRKYIVRRPVVEINEENAVILQFLDCLKDMDKCAESDLEMCGCRYLRQQFRQGWQQPALISLITVLSSRHTQNV